MSQCRDRCGTEVEWRKHERTGKTMLIETAPNRWGNLVLGRDGKTFRVANEKEYVHGHIADQPTLHISHIGRCRK